jgi:Zn-dependent protease with chaperone function
LPRPFSSRLTPVPSPPGGERTKSDWPLFALLALLVLAAPAAAGPQPQSAKQASQLRRDSEKNSNGAIVAKPPTAPRPPGVIAYVLVGLVLFSLFYAVAIPAMALLGWILAYFTRGLRALELLGKPPDQLVAGGKVGRTFHESWLTRVYAIVLATALLLFYAAVPFVIWGLILLTFVVMLAGQYIRRGHHSAELHDRMVYAGAGSVGAVFRALFARFAKGSFGLIKDPDDCPRLYRTLAEVASRVDTEPIAEVYLDPGCGVAVHQEGRGPFGAFGVKRRVLTLGVSTLQYLTVAELKSILAHEYAHFSHADTFWIVFIHQVTLSIATATRGMFETGGWLTFANPFYWFFYLYQKAYALLSSGFSRSREFLADRMACSLYGSDVFATALEKVCTDGALLERTLYRNTRDLLDDGKAYVNMYLAYRKSQKNGDETSERNQLRKKLLRQEGSLFASHPTFAERVSAVRHLASADKLDSTPAMELFESPAQIEKELTDFLTAVLNEQHRMRRRW